MLVSINGRKPEPVQNVVVYRDDTPVAACAAMGEDVIYADGIRDPEFVTMLETLGVHTNKLPIKGPTIQGGLQ